MIFLSYFSIICPCFVEELCDKDLNTPQPQPTPGALSGRTQAEAPTGDWYQSLGGRSRDQWWSGSMDYFIYTWGLIGGIYTLLGTNISPEKSILKMIFLFLRWVLLISWTVRHLLTIDPNFLGDPSKSGFVDSEGLKNGFSFIKIKRLYTYTGSQWFEGQPPIPTGPTTLIMESQSYHQREKVKQWEGCFILPPPHFFGIGKGAMKYLISKVDHQLSEVVGIHIVLSLAHSSDMFSPRKTKMAMEKQPFEGVSPIKKWWTSS